MTDVESTTGESTVGETETKQAEQRPAAHAVDSHGAEVALSRRRVLQGRVISDKPAKCVVVEVIHRVKHKTYGKYVTRRERYMAHDEKDEYRTGDVVRVVESRPLSRRKRWRVQTLVERPQ